MAREIALVETPEQLPFVPPGALVIALAPTVELDASEFRRPEDYFDERELEEDGIANFGKVEELCRLLDEGIQREWSYAADHDLQPARFNFFYLKVIYDAFFLRTYQLRDCE